jgi:hypothetical protein
MTLFELLVIYSLAILTLLNLMIAAYIFYIFKYITGAGESKVIEAIKRMITNDSSQNIMERDPYIEAYEGNPDENKRINTVRR